MGGSDWGDIRILRRPRTEQVGALVSPAINQPDHPYKPASVWSAGAVSSRSASVWRTEASNMNGKGESLSSPNDGRTKAPSFSASRIKESK
jgi:hypothetical protein